MLIKKKIKLIQSVKFLLAVKRFIIIFNEIRMKKPLVKRTVIFITYLRVSLFIETQQQKAIDDVDFKIIRDYESS